MTESVRAIVEFVPGSNPIQGNVVEPDGASQPFIGWLGLVGLLERAVSIVSPDQPPAMDA